MKALRQRHEWRKNHSREALTHKVSKPREFNRTQGYFIGISLIILLSISGLLVFDQGLKNPNSHGLLGGTSPLDPITAIIYTDTLPSGDLSGYNTFLASYNAGSIRLAPNSTHTAIALTRSSFNFGLASAKHLLLDTAFFLAHYPASNTRWGFYLTLNGTVPKTQSYQPRDDVNVALLVELDSDGLVSPNVFISLFLQHDINRAVSSNLPSSNCQSNSNCFIALQDTVGFGIRNNLSFGLNYTGTQASGGNNGRSYFQNRNLAVTSVFHFPWFALTQNYFIGFFERPTPDGGVLDWSFTAPVTCSVGWTSIGDCDEFMAVYVPTPGPNPPPPQPTGLDTGGFFGPIIKALISIGTFIAQGIITFGTFLYFLLSISLSGWARIIGLVIQTVFNTLGGIFGNPILGDQINSLFSNLATYLSTVFANALGFLSSIVSFLQNGITFIQNYFTNFIAFLLALLGIIPNLFTPILSVWNEIMKYYNLGAFSIQAFLVIFYIFGMFKVYNDGTEGFKDWLGLGELFTLRIFRGSYWFMKEAYDFVVKLKQLLFGNRVSPGTIAGNA